MRVRTVIAAGIFATGMVARPAAADVPERLDRAMIAQTVAKLKPDVMACGERHPAKGAVKVSVKVDPAGTVGSASIVSTPDQALGECVADVMKKGAFPQTKQGGAFSYPFLF